MPIAKKKTAKKTTAKKSIQKKKGAAKVQYSAAEEFAGESEFYKGDQIEKMRRKLRGREVEIAEIKRVEFDDDTVWVLVPDDTEFDLGFRINKTAGRNLAADLGDDIMSWVGSKVAITATKTVKGYGVTIDAVVDESADDAGDLPGDDELE